jgi:2-polyprenyl-3-methyl-5-hydroxy-6-metoxy-1,4-benzoquinol methylase
MSQLISVPCPLCREAAPGIPVDVPDEDGNIRGYGAIYEGCDKSEWKICARCGFVHQNPRPSTEALNAYYLEGQYHPHADAPEPAALVEINRSAYRDEIDFALEHSGLTSGTVFDIGCGWGVALKLWRDRGFTPRGVEPDRFLYEYGSKNYQLDLIENRILDGTIEVPEKVDIVFSHHTLEHVADLDALMVGIKKILRVGGYIFTALPTYRHNRTSMSKLWMNSGHYSLFTVQTFNQLLARHGFVEVAHRYEHWASTPDQFGHVARYVGEPTDPEQFYEAPDKVARYLRVENPLRSIVYYPLYGGYRRSLAHGAALARRTVEVLRTDPMSLPRRAREYLESRRSRV